jgi:uncharacterized protein (TIGR03086 family)
VVYVPPDLRPGPDSRPTDELASAEDTLGVLQQVLHTVAADDMSSQTPCTQFNVAQLTDHLLNSITAIGAMVGAEIPATGESESAELRVVSAARPALDAWHRRGLDGSVPFGDSEMPATGACGILSVEFLVHAWDYARAVGHGVDVPEPLAEYVLGVARAVIQPELRSQAGFDDPVAVAEDAAAVDRLVAFTGRDPRSA